MKYSVLRNHSRLFKLYLERKKEIEYLYDTRKSVAGTYSGNPNKGAADPVLSAVLKIDKKKEDLIELWRVILEEEEEIFSWLDQIPDHCFRAIVINRFINGFTWERVDYELARADQSGNGSGSMAANYYKRYVNAHPGLFEEE